MLAGYRRNGSELGCPMKEGSNAAEGPTGAEPCWVWVGFALVVGGQMDPFLFVLLF